jgi:hypothetical protein
VHSPKNGKNNKLFKILLFGAWIVNNKKFNQFLLLGKPIIGLVGIFIKQLKKCFKNAILG